MPRDGSNIPTLGIDLNEGQTRAKAQVMATIRARGTHLLTGHAGSGKTTLVQVIAAELQRKKTSIVLTAPTHKAVAVLSKKLKAADIDIPCVTIQSLLQLKPQPHGDRMVFERAKHAGPVTADVVVIDECSMIDASLLRHIELHLPVSAVLFVGDPAQLPPVGEAHSKAFETQNHSHLEAIVRQAAGNPILDAADALRRQQGAAIDWTWARKAMAKPFGVYLPGDGGDAWMRKAFTSSEFAGDTDSYRYICWTNSRVAEVNAKVRRWLYGADVPTPFFPGERVLARSPVSIDDNVIMTNNEEATALLIERADVDFVIPSRGGMDPWRASIPTWRIQAKNDEDASIELDAVRDTKIYLAALDRLKEEVRRARDRWKDFHAFKQRFAVLQSVYAQTVHSSQGSTYRNAFLDMGEMRRWARSDTLEAQRAMYVAATRPTHALVLIGAQDRDF